MITCNYSEGPIEKVKNGPTGQIGRPAPRTWSSCDTAQGPKEQFSWNYYSDMESLRLETPILFNLANCEIGPPLEIWIKVVENIKKSVKWVQFSVVTGLLTKSNEPSGRNKELSGDYLKVPGILTTPSKWHVWNKPKCPEVSVVHILGKRFGQWKLESIRFVWHDSWLLRTFNALFPYSTIYSRQHTSSHDDWWTESETSKVLLSHPDFLKMIFML